MKVIIADDEVHICSLIKHVIHWDELGLELLGVFQNGDDVAAQFAVEPADILICDIEMPGMTGTELIRHIADRYPHCRCMVVSGFRNFEYARSAMQFGVSNYLLKPIDADELNSALRAMVERTQEGLSTDHAISEQHIRLGFADAVRAGLCGESVDSVNSAYHYRFRNGLFGAIKAVFTGIEVGSDVLPRIMSIFTDTIKQRLLDFCCEAEVFRLSPVSALVLYNLQDGELALARPIIERSLRETLIDLGGKTPCATCIIGVGAGADNIHGLKMSWDSAEQVICNRFRERDRQIFYAEGADDAPPVPAAGIGREERRVLAGRIEAIDLDGVRDWLDRQFAERERVYERAPRLVYDFCYEVVDLLLHTLDELDVPVGNKEELRAGLAVRLDNSRSLGDARRALGALIEEQMSSRMQDKQQNMHVYAQQAKNYIDRHFADEVTLEIIAERLHINPVYLSVVFKQETGMNYSKYLAAVRVEKSKALLRDHTLNLTQVANAVGYDSTSYFSNLFRKHTGLRPSEYRRLHQHDIGE